VPILFEVCGDGAALDQLNEAVKEKGLYGVVCIRGRLARPELLQVYARAHAVIVPTRSDFSEGFAMVCAEAILSGRPVITSRVVPALEVLGAACMEACTDDIDSYVSAIQKLAEDGRSYEQLCGACSELSRQFLDRTKSYAAAVDRLMVHLVPKWRLLGD